MSVARTPLLLSSRAISAISRKAASSSTPCLLCASHRSHVPIQKRYKARRAPSTRLKDRQEAPLVLTPEVLERKQKRDDLANMLAETQHLSRDQKLAIFAGNQALSNRLTDRASYFIHDFRTSKGSVKEFEWYMQVNGIDTEQVYEASTVLRQLGTEDQIKFGTYLVQCCDRAGYPEATIQVLASLLRQDIANPGRLKTREALLSHNRLRELAKQGHLRAMVLDGKLAERKGDPELAISLYEKAAEGFSDPEEVKRMSQAPKTTPDGTPDGIKQKIVLDELSSPWMELGILNLRRGNRTKALEAYMLGIELGDPMAHQMVARLDFQFSRGEYSNEWLYHTTKAAASGHFKAAYSLGEYYANTKAPPPPHEQAPSNTNTETSTTEAPSPFSETLSRLRTFFTTFFLQEEQSASPEATIAHHAAAVSSPHARIQLASSWFLRSAEQAYLPAALALARLHARRFVLPEHNLTAPLPQYSKDFKKDDIEILRAIYRDRKSGKTPQIPNPLYHPVDAQACLGTIFRTSGIIKAARENARSKLEFRTQAGFFAQYPDVLEDYEHGLDDLLDEAKGLADEIGIDAVDPREGTVLYRHRASGGSHGKIGVVDGEEKEKETK